MSTNRKWIPARKTHLHYYDDIPLYYRTPSGNISLYKPAGMSFTHESLERKYAIDEFFIHPENRLESIEAAQKGFNSSLRDQISNAELSDIKNSLTELVEETLSAPRAGGLTRVPMTVNQLVDGFSIKPAVIKNFAKISFNDYTTALHSVNVMALTIGYCYYVSLPEDQTRKLGLAALLHDVGKTEVPPYLLKATRRLSDDEFDQIKAHTTRGYEILKSYKEEEIVEIAGASMEHHEKLDGSGYPHGKTDISYFGRVLSIIDCYEAITNDDRPYRTALSPMNALELIKKDVDAGKLDKKIFRDFAYSLTNFKRK
ncbi:MAG: HD domain-containing protein [Spirochaetales bacterium]|uniref:HD domain-containing protein n=1 Tax=Candidatus Thalassospirochaeta sargassi TaxID=3119039 RepID=A0AAJ1IE73_9SPIO|nr:HD domain-containing protein [Spirochaetales bacterium]